MKVVHIGEVVPISKNWWIVVSGKGEIKASGPDPTYLWERIVEVGDMLVTRTCRCSE